MPTVTVVETLRRIVEVRQGILDRAKSAREPEQTIDLLTLDMLAAQLDLLREEESVARQRRIGDGT